MRKVIKGTIALLLLTTMILVAVAANASIAPFGYQEDPTVYGIADKDISLREGPGTKYFNNIGGRYEVEGERLKILARAYDPNNGIMWVKTEMPARYGNVVGWIPYSRFQASTFDLEKVPLEHWYPGY